MPSSKIRLVVVSNSESKLCQQTLPPPSTLPCLKERIGKSQHHSFARSSVLRVLGSQQPLCRSRSAECRVHEKKLVVSLVCPGRKPPHCDAFNDGTLFSEANSSLSLSPARLAPAETDKHAPVGARVCVCIDPTRPLRRGTRQHVREY